MSVECATQRRDNVNVMQTGGRLHQALGQRQQSAITSTPLSDATRRPSRTTIITHMTPLSIRHRQTTTQRVIYERPRWRAIDQRLLHQYVVHSQTWKGRLQKNKVTFKFKLFSCTRSHAKIVWKIFENTHQIKFSAIKINRKKHILLRTYACILYFSRFILRVD